MTLVPGHVRFGPVLVAWFRWRDSRCFEVILRFGRVQ